MAWLEEAPSGTFEKAKTYETASLGPRQEHARVESVKETRFADPALLLDEDAVHHGDLSCRTAETQGRDAQPYPECLAE
jgi:hypothetical protein